ncbi:prolyl oligopeptidase family protein [Pedobacter glucosidilyticus]|nr:prolyl oligopeptidase family serine peptidase [Pedobacter glucosidilyticus]KHJ39435.1 prolyl oligopeptidase family protein [Pedobacter glucosidilyticus]
MKYLKMSILPVGRFLVPLLITLLVVFLGCKKSEAQQAGTDIIKGPKFIKDQFVKKGVFKSPNYAFTKDYDNLNTNNQKGLFFNGLNYHGKPTQVFCWYGVPTDLPKGKKAPAVILVHGGGGTLFPEWVKKWNDKGYIAISVALEGQIPGARDLNNPLDMKWPRAENSGPYRKGFFLDLDSEVLEDTWFYHAVANVIMANSLLRSFPEVDTSKIGITGISWGGILTNVITGIDNRFAFAIPVYGCGYLLETPTYSRQFKALSLKAQKTYLEYWEPSLYVPLQKQPTLFINGSNDSHFTMNSFTKTYLASTAEKYLSVNYKMTHGHQPGWAPKEIYAFANYVVNKDKLNKPIVAVGTGLVQNNLQFEYEGDVLQSKLYFTTDTSDWAAANYNWIEVPAQISSKTRSISVSLPKDALYYFLNSTSASGDSYSTPMVKVKK